MDIKDILTLVNAGFTAEMIAGFAKTAPKPEPKSEIIKRLDELTNAIQTNNTVSATAPTPKENDINDVILNLIKEV